MDLSSYLADMKNLVDSELDGVLPSDGSVLCEAMRYSALAPGKRIRGILVLESFRICGGYEKKVIPFACAVELLHTFSLIHDDLPSMDNDDLRRGLPTCHKKFGEATAILAADGLFALAYEIMSCKDTREKIDNNGAVLDSIERISLAIGPGGMCLGQCNDMLSEGKNITLDDLKNIHSKKTGALISACIYCGARLAGAGIKQIEKLEQYASHVGLAFQIKDDILDLIGTSRELGKNPGSDEKRDKATFPSIVGKEKAAVMLENERTLAVSALEEFGEKAEVLSSLADHIVSRTR
ncbi:MAG: polyprenyl synthetase family protein [Candidatus Margulisiibacteriota bacterium]